LIKWISDIMRDSTTQEQQHARGNDSKLLVPKFITPCIGQIRAQGQRGSASDVTHCDAKQRLILRTPVSRLIDILASDLRNPIKRAYIFAHNMVPESRSMFADFAQRSGEILIVKKVAVIDKH
jgi:hypothetical protein